MSFAPRTDCQQAARGRVVLIATAADSSWVVYRALAAEFHVCGVIVEEPPSRRRLLRNRLKRLGLVEVAGQLAFQAGVAPVLAKLSRRRARQIARDFHFDSRPPPAELVHYVPSVNGPEAASALQLLRPDVVVLNGTRILNRTTLQRITVPVINMHAGITPLYRGVHGGYWALATGRPDQCGVTVHLVDEGVDTGGVLGQAPIRPAREDNFTTYPLLQLGAGLPLLQEAVRAGLGGRLRAVEPPGGVSRQWYHPTAWGYLHRLLRAGLK